MAQKTWIYSLFITFSYLPMPQTTDKFAIFPYSGMDAPDENIL